MKYKKVLLGATIFSVVLAGFTTPVHAALTATSTLSQTINNGTISTDFRDASNALVSNPTFNMNATTISTSTQTVTGTLGTASQRLSVDNPGGAPNGFTLTLNATVPGTGTWTSGGNTYPYNGASAAAGQLTVNPSAGTWTALTGSTTAITKGTSATFSGATAITLATASATLEDIWNGYVIGIGLSQTIPAGKPAGTYTISMTQTVAAT